MDVDMNTITITASSNDNWEEDRLLTPIAQNLLNFDIKLYTVYHLQAILTTYN